METQLLAIVLNNRSSFEKVYGLITLKQHSREFQLLMKLVAEFYQRDPNAQSVDTSLVYELIAANFPNPKHIERFKMLVDEARAADVSTLNVETTIIEVRKREIEQQIAIAAVNKDNKLLELIEEYQNISKINTFDELISQGATVVEKIDVAALVAERGTEGMLMQVFPRVVNNRLGGGLLPGHHVTIFARPEMGKSATIINMGAGFARQGFRVLHIENEDRPSDVQMRYVSNLSGMARRDILGDPVKAQRLADSYGMEQITVAELTPGTPQQIEELIERYQPNVCIVNQLRNLNVSESNKVIALEKAATEVRNIGKRGNVAMISVTQAGDSADGKKFLEMGDVDFSNTGIPAQCDVLMGIGADEPMLGLNERGISFPKNKIGGEDDSHDPVIVRINKQLSRLLSPNGNSEN